MTHLIVICLYLACFASLIIAFHIKNCLRTREEALRAWKLQTMQRELQAFLDVIPTPAMPLAVRS